MPKNAEILTASLQKDTLYLWALVDTEVTNEYRYIGIFGTGNPIYWDIHRYISSFQLYEGDLIFHVFELNK